MNICKISIENFRGIKTASILLDGNAVFVGDNNTGKSTIFEAIDLVMGPDRLNRHPVIDEHDFYAGEYLVEDSPVEIIIEVIITNLNDEMLIHFGNHIEWWNNRTKELIKSSPAEETNSEYVLPALRLLFKGSYDSEEDDFAGATFFAETLKDGGTPERFNKKDKRKCGFLYLRTLRTGNRALSLDHGSLLDIILQLKEARPMMWENIISQLKTISVAGESELGVSDILTSVQDSISTIVSYESANNPQMRVSNLTREHLRKVLTVFMGSGSFDTDGNEYATPYYHQGTGTINTLVLSLLSMIADLKDNVIFAMEEPEIALPPHIQKRVVLSVIEKSNQALFTSHSPYVLEEFSPNSIIAVSKNKGVINAVPVEMPPSIKKKQYREEFRKRFCESLLARRVLITEGRTEYDIYSSSARKLQELHKDKSYSFELLGISLINAETDTQIAALGHYYKRLNKTVYAVFDKQSEQSSVIINDAIDYAYESNEKGIENLVLNNIEPRILKEYALKLVEDKDWPQHFKSKTPNDNMSDDEIKSVLFEYFKWSKGSGTLADLVLFCDEEQMPHFIRETIINISQTIYSQPAENDESKDIIEVEGLNDE